MAATQRQHRSLTKAAPRLKAHGTLDARECARGGQVSCQQPLQTKLSSSKMGQGLSSTAPGPVQISESLFWMDTILSIVQLFQTMAYPSLHAPEIGHMLGATDLCRQAE